jgi:hypothetical protein
MSVQVPVCQFVACARLGELGDERVPVVVLPPDDFRFVAHLGPRRAQLWKRGAWGRSASLSRRGTLVPLLEPQSAHIRARGRAARCVWLGRPGAALKRGKSRDHKQKSPPRPEPGGPGRREAMATR